MTFNLDITLADGVTEDELRRLLMDGGTNIPFVNVLSRSSGKFLGRMRISEPVKEFEKMVKGTSVRSVWSIEVSKRKM